MALLQSIASLPSLSMRTHSEAEFTPTGLLTGSPLSSGTEGVGRRSSGGKEAGLQGRGQSVAETLSPASRWGLG